MTLAWAGAAGGLVPLAVSVGAAPLYVLGAYGVLVAVAVVTAIGRARRERGPARSVGTMARALPLRRGLADDLAIGAGAGAGAADARAAIKVSRALVRALIDAVAAELATLDVAALVPMRAVARRAQLWTAVVLSVGAVIALTAGARWRAGWARLYGIETASAAQPLLGDLRVTLTYPAYTQLPPRVLVDTSGDFAALPGTRVSFDGQLLVPAASAELLLTKPGGKSDASSLGATLSAHSLHAETTVTEAFDWQLLVAKGRRRLVDSAVHHVTLTVDRAPHIDLFVPAEPLSLEERRPVELGWVADDDYGIARIDLVWQVEGAPAERQTIFSATQQKDASQDDRKQQGRHVWDISTIELGSASQVSYHLEAIDRDDIRGPHIGRSRVFHLILHSGEQQHEESLASERRLLDALVEALGARLDLSPPSITPPSDLATAAQLTVVHRQLEGLLGQLTRTESLVQHDASSTESTRRTLSKIHTRLAHAVAAEAPLVQQKRKRAAKAGGWPPLWPAHIAELEADTLLIDDLIGQQRLEGLLRVADEMAHARDRLKQLLADYKKTHDEKTKQQILSEIARLQQKLAELARQAASMEGELPDQFLNRQAMGKNDMGQQLEQLKKQLADGNMDEAERAVEQLSNALDQMTQSMEGDLRGYRKERMSAQEKALAEAESEVADLTEDQRALNEKTDALAAKERAQRMQKAKERAQKELERLKREANELGQRIDDVGRDALSDDARESVERARQRVRDLSERLTQGDIGEAGAMADESAKELAEADDALAEAKKNGPRPRVQKAGAQAKSLAKELRELASAPGDSTLTPDEAKQLAELGKGQAAAKKRADALGGKLKKAGIPPSLSGKLDRAGGHMGGAEQKLQGQDAPGATGEQKQALDELGQLKDALARERRPSSGGSSVDNEPVKIPGADEFRAPREFRQELLEAMKRAHPGRFSADVERYYEELSK